MRLQNFRRFRSERLRPRLYSSFNFEICPHGFRKFQFLNESNILAWDPINCSDPFCEVFCCFVFIFALLMQCTLMV